MEEALTVLVAVAGGSAVPFLVGYFVHAGAAIGGNRVPWPLESRTRLVAESGYYFVALFIAIVAAAAVVWKLGSIDPGWIFLIQFGPAGVSLLIFSASLTMRNTTDGTVNFISNTESEFLALYFILLPVIGWAYIVRMLGENWGADSASQSNPLSMPLPLAVLFLTPLALLTFSATAQCWGILFAYHRYRYPEVELALTDGSTLRGRLVRDTDNDVRIVVHDQLTIIGRDVLARITVLGPQEVQHGQSLPGGV